MKKTFIRLVATIAIMQFNFVSIKAQGVQVSDFSFESFLIQKYPSCIDHFDPGSGYYFDPNCSAFQTEDSLDLSGRLFTDYTPLSWFISLRYLNVSHVSQHNGVNFFSLMQNLPATLRTLIARGFSFPNPAYPNHNFFPDPGFYMGGNLPPSLETLDFSGNYSTNFFSSLPPGLKYLNCSGNCFTSLGTLPNTLETMMCDSIIRTDLPDQPGLDVLPSILPASLKYLSCRFCSLDAIPTNLPAGLTYFDISNNLYGYAWTTGGQIQYYGGVSSLPILSPSMQYFNCSNSILPSAGTLTLSPLPSTLTYLNCRSSHLASLPALPANLQYLNCSLNTISSLSSLPTTLQTLDCSLNNISCIPKIPPSLLNLTVDRPEVTCLPNSGNYAVAGGPIQLCSVINNSHHCQNTGIVSGNMFYDNNSNGIKDPGENYRANVQAQLSNGLNAFTNSNGYYEISADPGNYVLSVIAPAFYDAVPSPVNYSVNSTDTIIHDEIALQPNVIFDSTTLSIIPMFTPRPGFGFTYKVSYENVGTTVVSPNIVFNYDNSKLSFNSSSNAAVIDNGSSLSLTGPNFSPGERNSFEAFFTVKVTAVIGDTIRANGAINAGSNIVTDSSYSIIQGSFDPNDKHATPRLSTLQVADGRYIDYLIRFQNTGTLAAINVVVTDTLNSSLVNGSVQILDASHNCNVSQSGDKLAFEFLNILLPSKNVDEPGSHGFIRFRAKPQPGTPANSIIPNKANIYFDYNAGVLTNTANTLIQLNPIPLSLLSFKAFQNASNMVLLSWNTANENNTRSFDIEQSTDGTRFIKIGAVNASGRGDNSYNFRTNLIADLVYFRLKMIDIDGRFTYSFIIPVKRNGQMENIIVLNNPVQQKLDIVVNEASLVNSEAVIINGQGQTMQRFILKDGEQYIDVSKLAAGMYYLKATGITKKIIISR